MADDKAERVAELVEDTESFDDVARAWGADPSIGARAALANERIGNLLPAALGELERRGRGESMPIELRDWPRMATALGGGLWPGCHVLTGGTGSGKSQLALQLALQAAQDGIPTRYVALELDALGLVARLLCMMAGDGAGVWWSSLYTGRNDRGDLLKGHKLGELHRAYGAELAALPLYLSTDQGAHGWSYDAIGPTVEQLRAAHPEAAARPVLLVVDFLQLLASPDGAPGEDVRERIGKAAYQARNAAREQNAAILLLSSTARNNYEATAPDLTPDGVPGVSAAGLVGMGKESGEIEYAADSALVLCRAPGDPDAVWLAVAKLRAGRAKWLRLVERNGWLSEGGPGTERGPPGTAGTGNKPGDKPLPAKVDHLVKLETDVKGAERAAETAERLAGETADPTKQRALQREAQTQRGRAAAATAKLQVARSGQAGHNGGGNANPFKR